MLFIYVYQMLITIHIVMIITADIFKMICLSNRFEFHDILTSISNSLCEVYHIFIHKTKIKHLSSH